ncbi:hypothetical protein DL96DRAFT_1586501 [Flagelloscypha sp. PMI_526]|nr:hypothetical protein DL96DRAFT_1586501 [Flagelloscypha sp. PMI_526]
MAESWPDVFEAKAQVQAILRNHGSFTPKEFIQNSEDARANCQVLIYDQRDFSSAVDGPEKVLLGPAIVAWNDAILSQKDWESIRRMNASRKNDDADAIGKFGISDFLQVFSDGQLGILDPAQIASRPTKRQGTFIRFPLRLQKASKSIIDHLPSISSIHHMLHHFISEDLSVCLLFLENLKSISIWEIVEDTAPSCLALAKVSREPMLEIERHHATRVSVSTQDSEPQIVEWQVLRSAFPMEEAIQLLGSSLDSAGILDILRDAKLRPDVSIAIPIGSLPRIEGKLFNSLPLPISTSFPCHVHGRFLLDSSRCHLKNSRDEGSTLRERTLSRWNTVLISQFLPRTWTTLLKVLTDFHHISDIFSAWPPACTQIDNYHGESLLSALIRNIVEAQSIIWPVYSVLHQTHVGYRSVEDVLVTCYKETKGEDVVALTSCGLRLSVIPNDVYDCLSGMNNMFVRLLKPGSAWSALQDITPTFEDWSVALIAGLPLVVLSNGQRYENELSIFGPFDTSFVVLDQQATELRHLLEDRSPSPVFLDAPSIERFALNWLEMFWVWLAGLAPEFKEQLLLPCRYGLRIVRFGLFPIHTNVRLVTALESFGVGFLNMTFGGTSRPLRSVLEGFGLMKSWDSIDDLSYHVSFGGPVDQNAFELVLKHVVKRCSDRSLNCELLQEVASWPLFPIISSPEGLRTCVSDALPNSGTLTLLATAEPPPPTIDGITFVDNRTVDLRPFIGRLGLTITCPLNTVQLLRLAIDHFPQQTPSYKDVILQFMENNCNSLPSELFAMVHDLENLSDDSPSDSSSSNDGVNPQQNTSPNSLTRAKSHSNLEIQKFVDDAHSFCQGLSVEPNAQDIKTATTLFRRFCESSVVHQYLCSDAQQLEHLASLRLCHRAPERREYSSHVLLDDDESIREKISQTLCSTNEIARTELLPVCWTMGAALVDTSLSLPLYLGIPSVNEVVNHLRHLVRVVWPRFRGQAEVVDDIMQTYAFLTDHIDQLSEELVQDLDSEALFLNVDTLDTPAEHVWRSSSEMCFGIRDTDGLFRVRKMLHRFKPLLLALGVDDIIHDSSSSRFLQTTLHQGPLQRANLANDFRLSQHLCDVKFGTNDPNIFLWAHRSELSFNVLHFRRMFTNAAFIEGRWSACPADPVKLNGEVSPVSLNFVLHWIYTQTFPPQSDDDIIECIDEILHLCDRWELETLKDHIADIYITNQWMSPVDCRSILEVAMKYRASRLKDAAEKFMEVNRRAVEKQDQRKARNM